MSTQAQTAANHANSQHSAGPRTAEGKALSAMNNFRHGFNSAFSVLPWEQEEEFEKLLNGLRDEHKPSTLTETMLVEKMVQAAWLSKRAVVLQHTTFNHRMPGCDDQKQRSICVTRPRTTGPSTSPSTSF